MAHNFRPRLLNENEREIRYNNLKEKLRREIVGNNRYLQPIQWRSVTKILLWIRSTDPRLLWDIIRFVFSLFDSYICRDVAVIGEVLVFACSLFGNLPIAPDLQAYAGISCFRPDWFSIEYRQTFVNLMRLPYGKEYGSDCINTDMATTLIKNGNDHLLSAILRYGFMCMPFQDKEHVWRGIEDILKRRLESSFPHLQLRNVCNACETIKSLPPDERRRMLTVFKGVEIILRDRMHQVPVQKSVKCLRMVFESIPEPIITSREIGTFLELILGNASVEAIPEICSDYASKFPESVGDLKPRSLAHLSRCQVRQLLREAHSLPYGVEALPISQHLKDYILLEWYTVQ